MELPRTLGELKQTDYKSKTVKEELRDNLVKKLKSKEVIFEHILGFEDTVLPDIERAVLARHNILLLGLRGQAKTRIARLLVGLLDEFMPVVKGSELNDDPLQPISRYAIDKIEKEGDDTPIEWIHRSERYVEKLATPDVSVADLVGDVDPIKAANLKLPYSDERVIHFGLIPRAHRSIFVINELPDLQARIQVALFNMLQEGDIQIRGFKLRLPLDIQFVFTANPEDYTNRGSIITPLKDRIESQILTHYPKTVEISRKITQQEAELLPEQQSKVVVPEIIQNLLEEIAFEARVSELIDEKSGVSARMSISAFEMLVATAERRALINEESKTIARFTDLWGIIPAITGKVELVYEGEQEGPYMVALALINGAIQRMFLDYFPDPEKLKKGQEKDPYGTIRAFFAGGNTIELYNDDSNENYEKALLKVAGLKRVTEQLADPDLQLFAFMELLLNGLSTFNIINKDMLESGITYKDLLANMLDDSDLLDD
jgi:magnesium chelatase subunit I